MIWGYHYFWKHPHLPRKYWRPLRLQRIVEDKRCRHWHSRETELQQKIHGEQTLNWKMPHPRRTHQESPNLLFSPMSMTSGTKHNVSLILCQVSLIHSTKNAHATHVITNLKSELLLQCISELHLVARNVTQQHATTSSNDASHEYHVHLNMPRMVIQSQSVLGSFRMTSLRPENSVSAYHGQAVQASVHQWWVLQQIGEAHYLHIHHGKLGNMQNPIVPTFSGSPGEGRLFGPWHGGEIDVWFMQNILLSLHLCQVHRT